MFRFTGSALALLVAVSLVPLSSAVSGDRGERHRIVKHAKFKLTDRDRHRSHRRTVRVVNRNVVVVKTQGRYRPHDRRHYQANTYSGDVVIDVRNGVGRWSYGGYSAESVSVSVVPKARIIDVGALKDDSACEMQAGVCVIRP